MGYATTTMKQAVDELDNLVWQDTPQGKVPQLKKEEYGAMTICIGNLAGRDSLRERMNMET